MDRRTDPRIRAAAAQVPAHPRVDRRVVWRRVRLEQRHRGQRLPGLAVTALHDVAAVPRVADRVDHRAGGTLDRRHRLADRTLGRGLARLHVAPVDQHRARRAEAGAAAELRAVQAEDVPEHPQQRGLRVPVVDLDLGAVDDELHLRPPLTGTCGRCCTGRTIAPTQVSCPHRMMVISPATRCSSSRSTGTRSPRPGTSLCAVVAPHRTTGARWPASDRDVRRSDQVGLALWRRSCSVCNCSSSTIPRLSTRPEQVDKVQNTPLEVAEKIASTPSRSSSPLRERTRPASSRRAPTSCQLAILMSRPP